MSIINITPLAVVAALLASTTAQAEVTGGRLAFSHSFFTEDASFAKTNLNGSVELGFSQQFGLQVDLGVSALNAIGETTTNLGLHGLYHVSDSTSLGLFYAMDFGDGGSQDLYGLEIGQEVGSGGVEAYVARATDEGDAVTLLGLSGDFPLANGFGLGASLDHATSGDSATRFGVSANYALGDTSKVFAEIGTLSGQDKEGSGSETYAKIGATMNFGAKRGTTFGTRSLFNLLPGL